MAKKAKDLYKDLENYAENEKNKKIKFYASTQKRTNGFPWGILLIFSTVTSAYLLYAFNNKATRIYFINTLRQADAIVQNYQETGKLKFTAPKKVEYIQQSTKNSDADFASSEQDGAEKQYVQIDGEYYVKRSDNIYNVKGRRVFVKSEKLIKKEDNESKLPAQKNAMQVQETVKKLQNRSDFLNEVAESL